MAKLPEKRLHALIRLAGRNGDEATFARLSADKRVGAAFARRLFEAGQRDAQAADPSTE